MPATEELRDRIRSEERVVDLPDDGVFSRAAVRRRRRHLSLVALMVVVGLVVVTIVNDVGHLDEDLTLGNPGLVRALLIVFAGVVTVYVIDKERHLRRLEVLGHEQRTLNLALAESLIQASQLAETDRELTSVLDLREVLEHTVDRALEHVGATDGVVLLRCGATEFRAAAARTHRISWSSRIQLGESIEGRSRSTGELLAVSAPLTDRAPAHPASDAPFEGAAMFASLVDHGELLGVLAVGIADDRRFGSSELEVLGDIADLAGTAIGNARRHEAALLELDRTRTQLAQLVAGPI